MNNAEELINPRINVADLIFPIFSLVLCFFLFLLTLKLRSLTYDYLLCVFISEIINSIGNLLQYAEKDQAGKFLIPFSDIFTMTIFVFFTFSSYEHLIKSNKNIKKKKKNIYSNKYCIFSCICINTINYNYSYRRRY